MRACKILCHLDNLNYCFQALKMAAGSDALCIEAISPQHTAGKLVH